MVLMQIDSVVVDIGVDAVKIGMIGSAETAAAVAERLARPDLAGTPVVFDPVMIPTSGAALAGPDTIRAFPRLPDICTVAPPNLAEIPELDGETDRLPHG